MLGTIRCKFGRTSDLLLVTVIVMTGCRQEIVPEEFVPRYEYEAYLHSLEQLDLDQTALGMEWIGAGEHALRQPIPVSFPFQEELYWDSRAAKAVGYRFEVKRGSRVEVEIELRSQDSLRLFTDVFRETGVETGTWIHIASAESASNYLEFEPRRDASYVLRIQPELLRGGNVNIRIREVPSLGFPVRGKDSRSIRSFFGDPRDGGRREHHGVDIFAPRHTPVIAPVDGRITRVSEGRLGGNYVWLYDSKRSMHLYFAHLQTQDVAPQTRVTAGQIIGTVGNTGNARYTPPHLHFGIYSRGPIDPYYFIAETDTIFPGYTGDTLWLGEWVRTTQETTLRLSPEKGSSILDTLDQHAPMQVLALNRGSYRVQLPDGASGYLRITNLELLEQEIDVQRLPESIALLETPGQTSVRKARIEQGEIFTVLGRYDQFLYGTTREGVSGWVYRGVN